MLLLACLHLLFPRIRLVWADTHSQGIKTWARENLEIEIVKPVSVLSGALQLRSRRADLPVFTFCLTVG